MEEKATVIEAAMLTKDADEIERNQIGSGADERGNGDRLGLDREFAAGWRLPA